MTMRVRITKDDMCDAIRMLVWEESNGKVFIGQPIEFKEVEPNDCVKQPTLQFYQYAGGNAGAILQSMMDDLYRMGVRPSDHVPADVAVVKDEVIRAKDEHIADLRESVRANRDRPQVVMPTFKPFKEEEEVPIFCIKCGKNPTVDKSITRSPGMWEVSCFCLGKYCAAETKDAAIRFWNECEMRQRAVVALEKEHG